MWMTSGFYLERPDFLSSVVFGTRRGTKAAERLPTYAERRSRGATPPRPSFPRGEVQQRHATPTSGSRGCSARRPVLIWTNSEPGAG